MNIEKLGIALNHARRWEVQGDVGRRLVRVFVDVDRQPAEVVTAYRTSRIAKYWRESAI